jgi:hypothetical protein
MDFCLFFQDSICILISRQFNGQVGNPGKGFHFVFALPFFEGGFMAREKEKQKLTPEESIEGIFRTVGSFLDILSDMVEKGEVPIRRKLKAEFGERKGMKAAAVYGFTVKMGDKWQSGGQPFLEITTPEGKMSGREEVRESSADVFDDKETVVVVAEIPGASEKDITVEVRRYPNHHY